MTAKDLREKRATLAKQARDILDKAEQEKRDLSAEEQRQWDTIHADIDKLKGQIDRLERQEREELELGGSQGTRAGGRQEGPPQDPNGGSRSSEQADEKGLEAFRSWLVHGIVGLTPEHREIMARRHSQLPQEARAMAAGLDTAGGYTVFDSFASRIETAMKAFAGVRNTRATIVRTASGNDLQMPTADDTSNKGERLGENKTATEKDVTLGSKTLRAYMYSSKLVRVSYQFLQDTSIEGIEGWLAGLLGERIGRKFGEDSITGTGNNMPEGLAGATTLGRTGSKTDSVEYDDFVELEHAVNPAYRRQGEWLIGDGLLKAAKKLKDGEGRPLWVPGVAVREPDTILGKRYTVDEEIPTPAASAITMYFGDFSKFHIRDVSGMQMLRLTERYAEFLQVAFLLFSRHDAILLDAGTNPIKHFKQAA